MKKAILSLIFVLAIAYSGIEANTTENKANGDDVYEVMIELKWQHNGQRVDPEDYQEMLYAYNVKTGEYTYAQELSGTYTFNLEEGHYYFGGRDYYFVGIVTKSKYIEMDQYFMLEVWSE